MDVVHDRTTTRDGFQRALHVLQRTSPLSSHLFSGSKTSSIQGPQVALHAIFKNILIAFNRHMSSYTIDTTANEAPESARAFLSTLYDNLFIFGPTGQAHPRDPPDTHKTSGLRWHKCLPIERNGPRYLVLMAREKHRMPNWAWVLKIAVETVSETHLRAGFVYSNYWKEWEVYRIHIVVDRSLVTFPSFQPQGSIMVPFSSERNTC